MNRSLQKRYLFILVLSMVLPAVFIGGCLYYLVLSIIAEQLALPDIIARDLIPVIQRINFILIAGLPIVFLVLLSWAVLLSYRFVAPLERLEEDIKRIDEGDYSVRIQISKDHDLRPVADAINDLVDKLDKREKGG